MVMAKMEGLNPSVIQNQLDSASKPVKSLLLGLIGCLPEDGKVGSVYEDDKHFPFYYYLGQQLRPQKVLQIGPYLGIPAACFMQACDGIKEWWAISEINTYTLHNMRLYSRGTASVSSWDLNRFHNYNPDLVMISEIFDPEKYSYYLSYLWDLLKQDGFLVADFVSRSCAFKDFRGCLSECFPSVAFGTRYSVAVIQKRG